MADRFKFPRWLFIVAVVIFCVALLVLILVPTLRKRDPGRSYVVMVDAGSSSSKLYVYSWPSEASKDETPADIKQEFFQRTEEAGVSFYADKPENASKEIVDILKKNVLGDDENGPPAIIPEKQRARTPIYMGATAGMRLLVARDPVGAERLLNNLRTDFSKLGLLVENATKQMRVITGDEEALAGWISSNYLSDTLRPSPAAFASKPQEGTIGALDMGGASTQVSFVTTAPVGIEVTEISLYGRKFRVYQHSFLCFGKGEARNQIYASLWVRDGRPLSSKTIDNPCAQTGFSLTRAAGSFLQKPCYVNPAGRKLPRMTEKFTFRGSGDYKTCRQLTRQLFDRKACPYSRCSFDGIFQPPIPAGKFVAFSSYYFAMKFYNVTRDKATRAQTQQRLKDFCQRAWEPVRKQYTGIPTSFLSGYCFDGIYIDEVIRKLGFNDTRWSDIAFTGKIGKRKMSWPLGFILKESGGVPAGLVSYSIPQPTYVGVVVLFVILLLLAVVLILIFARSYWWSHQYSPANTEPSQKV